MTKDFSDTDHGKLLASAKGFLKAADVLRRSEEYKKSQILFAPTLHLTAHGIEVLLKANLVGAGLTLGEVKNKYGHSILKLWQHGSNQRLRDMAANEAKIAWQQAQVDGSWPDCFKGDPVILLNEYIAKLNELHTKDTDYALRYIPASGLQGPRPHLLIDTFLVVTDFCIRQPNALVLTANSIQPTQSP